MIKNCICFIAALLPLVLHAQVTMNVQLPTSGLMQKDQLWNIVLANSGSSMVSGTLFLNLQDRGSGQTVFSAVTGTVILGKGVKIVTSREVQPVTYQYNGAESRAGYLPAGSYLACYSFIVTNGDKSLPVADACERIDIAPLSPPLLAMPADGDSLQTRMPQFVWTPPTPVEMLDHPSYDLSLVEVMEGQAPADAIMYNTPVYSKNHCLVTYENYPPASAQLQPGKTYAWQVTARDGRGYAAATEVWSFRITDNITPPSESGSSYLVMGTNNAGSVHLVKDGSNLEVKYYSFDQEHATEIRFLSIDGKLLQKKRQRLHYGDNFLSFHLNHVFRPGQVYFIEIKAMNGRSSRTAFSIK